MSSQSRSSSRTASTVASARGVSRSARKIASRSAREASSVGKEETEIPRSRAWAARRSRVETGTLIVVVRVDIYAAYYCRHKLAPIWVIGGWHHGRNTVARVLRFWCGQTDHPAGAA